MTLTLSLDQFVESLDTAGLMTAEEVQDFLGNLSPASRPNTAQDLAKELTRQGKLTKYQVHALLQGKGRALVMGNYVVLDKLGKGGMVRNAGGVRRAGSKSPNAFGLYDMHGNVWEWCAGWFQREYYRLSPVDDPPGPSTAGGE